MKINLIFLTFLLSSFTVRAQQVRDTLYMDYPEDCTMAIGQQHDYTRTLVTKLFLSQAKFAIWAVDENGRKMIGKRAYSGGKVRLDVQEGQMLLLSFE